MKQNGYKIIHELFRKKDDNEPKKKNVALGFEKGALMGTGAGLAGATGLKIAGKAAGGEGGIKRGIKTVAGVLSPEKSKIGQWASKHSMGTSLRKIRVLPVAGVVGAATGLGIAANRARRNAAIDKLKDKKQGLIK